MWNIDHALPRTKRDWAYTVFVVPRQFKSISRSFCWSQKELWHDILLAYRALVVQHRVAIPFLASAGNYWQRELLFFLFCFVLLLFFCCFFVVFLLFFVVFCCFLLLLFLFRSIFFVLSWFFLGFFGWGSKPKPNRKNLRQLALFFVRIRSIWFHPRARKRLHQAPPRSHTQKTKPKNCDPENKNQIYTLKITYWHQDGRKSGRKKW